MSFVVASGSKQYLVDYGQQIIVDKLSANENDVVDLNILFALDGKNKSKKLSARVVRHQRGEKIRVVKYKPKSNYHKQYGHRSEETVLEILDAEKKS